MINLLKRYSQVLSLAWRERKALEPVSRSTVESQFLPAALELQDTPVSPAPRVAMWLIILFGVIAVVWAVFGRIDVVATARGKIIPSDRVKVVQPTETSVVKAIYVTEGQRVREGEALIDLDMTMTSADLTRVQDELTATRFKAARANGLLAATGDSKQAGAINIEGLNAGDRVKREQRLLNGQVNEYRARLTTIDAEIVRHEAELAVAGDMVSKLQQTSPLAVQRAKDYRELLEQNYVARHAYLEVEQVRIEQEQEYAAQVSRIRELKAALTQTRKERDLAVAETKRKALEDLNDAEQKIEALSQELVKAEQRSRLMRLTAPVDGNVQQLVVHTVGGVVTPAQPLMIVVPNNDHLEVEAYVENKDIGFVFAGQEAEVKIDSFPFTKYGTIPSTVVQVSQDAIDDEKKGLVYTARTQLSRTTMSVEGKRVNLVPGMAVMVEIKTGQRRVIEYFLGPLLQYKSESLHER